ncbi:MAG: NADH-quinone oxidoreductase subunit NuoG [Deltaproteobacteria bacterium]|nr:NADH-quinone oxidoreductase subunit NuoG [Deltaproteobacteria bacterium]
MATVKINGKEVIVEDNTLILDAARKAGCEIPTFCYQARLSKLGSCRMCLVEIEGQKKLQPACVTPVMHNMAVITESDAVKTSRSAMLEFLLSNHALDCPVCDKAGECELQDMVHKQGPRHGRHIEKKIRFHERDYVLSPVIVKNSNRCVKCMRCIRVCKEAVGAGVLGAVGRGAHQEETSFLRTFLDCDHDGNCIEVCPVGSFMRRPYRYTARPWDLKNVHTICPYCATGCRTRLDQRGGVIVRSVAKAGVGINGEFLCARGRFGCDLVNSAERLTTPLVRKDGALVPATWKEALAAVKEGLAKAGSNIGVVASPRLTNEELYLIQKLARGILKTENIDSASRWTAQAVEGFIAATGLSQGPTALSDCLGSDVVFVIGSQVSDENPVIDYLIRREADTRRTGIVIASARAMKLDSSAQITLRHPVAKEGEALRGIVAGLVEENKDRLSTIEVESLETSAQAAALNVDDLRAVAKRLNNVEKIAVLAGTEFLRYPENLAALSTFKEALKILGKTLHILPVLDRNNQRGAWDMGVHPSFGPGYARSTDKGFDTDSMLEQAASGSLDAMYVAGEDIIACYPDAAFARNALSKLSFLVVQDMFLTETIMFAHVVLPAASFAEKGGTFTNQEGRVQRIKALLPTSGEAKTGLDIIADIGSLFETGFGPRAVSAVFDEITVKNPMYRGLDFGGDETNSNALVKPSDRTFDAPYPSALFAAPIKDKDYPFTLITGNHLFFSGSVSRRSKILRSLLEEPVVEISEEDAAGTGLAVGDRVKVMSKGFEVEVNLKTRKGSVNGLAFLAENFVEAPFNGFITRGQRFVNVAITKVNG